MKLKIKATVVSLSTMLLLLMVAGSTAQTFPINEAGIAPVRVVLLLDRSGSMCDLGEPNDQYCGCSIPGDGSGYCMQNDPTNQRVVAAHLFVDSLRAKSSVSEIGIVRFASGQESHNPLSLASDANVNKVHDWIEDASCESSDGGLNGLGTNLGAALQEGLDLADVNYSSIDSLMTRHIILLTDGGWDDVDERAPDMIIDNYVATTGSSVPAIHTVLLTDSVLHLEHAYPPTGCASTGDVNPAYLAFAAELSGGMYFPGATPETIVDNFMTLFESITGTVPRHQGDSYTTRGTSVRSSLDIHQLSGNNRFAELHLSLSRPQQVHVSIHTLSGTLIAPPVNRYLPKGTHRLTYTTGNLSNGCYLVKCTAGAETITRTLNLIY